MQVEYLERLSESELDRKILELDDTTFSAVSDLVENLLARERQGFDRFFESISQTLKYLPNFLVLAITNKYIDPPIAAHITSKLPIKNAVQIAKGLSTRYVCETAVYLDEAYAARLLQQLPKKSACEIITLLVAEHPLKALDIFEYIEPKLLSAFKIRKSAFKLSDLNLNEVRRRTYEQI